MPNVAAMALHRFAECLDARRPHVLAAFRESVKSDPGIPAAEGLPDPELDDHWPRLLERFEEGLRRTGTEVPGEQLPAAQHGCTRSRQGYSLSETVGEWRHMDRCLRAEIGRWAADAQSPAVVAAVLAANDALAAFTIEGIRASVEAHREQQRAVARDRARELRRALEEVRRLERERTRTWRQAVHDLRGGLSAVTNASALMQRADAPALLRVRSEEALTRGLAVLRSMLDDLTSLARLEAGVESPQVTRFDVAERLRSIATSLEPLAHTRGLALEAHGTGPLEVEGDPRKVQRIVQNLVLNALRYTDQGSVRLWWGEDDAAGASRWLLVVEDTGPGLHASLADAEGRTDGERADPQSEDDSRVRPERVGGEGIGLTIVRQLCQLLHARLQIDSAPGQGTRVRIGFPARWPVAEEVRSPSDEDEGLDAGAAGAAG